MDRQTPSFGGMDFSQESHRIARTMLRDAQEDHTFDILNQWASSFEFSDQITSTALSFHGFIPAVGSLNGTFVLCDSETSTNRYTFSDYKAPVTAFSFSRHVHFIASADSSGYLQVMTILAQEIRSATTCSAGIASVAFHWRDLGILLVPWSNHSLSILNIDSGGVRVLPGEFVPACWYPRDDTIIAASGNEIFVVDESTLTPQSVGEIAASGSRISRCRARGRRSWSSAGRVRRSCTESRRRRRSNPC